MFLRQPRLEHADAILRYSDAGAPYEPEWPSADYIVGNPPFLGGKMLRRELGDSRVDDLFLVYDGKVPAQADLVTYWFEKARALVESGKVKRAGLLATQAIRDGANRLVLERVLATTSIFWAQGNLPWTLEGAAVRISMVAFDNGAETSRMLDGRDVALIHADLTSGANVASAQRLKENADLCFMGTTKIGPFDLSREDGERMLRLPLNPNHRPNADVVRPWVNGSDLTGRPRGMYIIDFGVSMNETEAALYEGPFEYVKKCVKPVRVKNNRGSYARKWWLHGEPRPELRAALSGLDRYIATPRVSKHRLFIWTSVATLPDCRLLGFARADDYFCGVLTSRFHELWSVANVSWHGGERPTYVKESCFETYPFPWPPGEEPQRHPHVLAIGAAVRRLVERRDAWLNPKGASEAEVSKRTLTNLYNQRPQWLDDLHTNLDRVVAAAYGWRTDISDDEVLARLLELNLERYQKRTEVPKKPSSSVVVQRPQKSRVVLRSVRR